MPIWVPKPVVNHWTVDVNRLNNVVASVDILITNDLHIYGLGAGFLLNIDCGNLLIDVFCKNCLYYNVVVAVFNIFNNS